MDSFEILDNSEQLNQVDKDGMLKVALDTPEMLAQAVELANKVKLPKIKKIKQIVVSGMGGSAIAGDIVADLLRETCPVPIYVNRDYRLPSFVGKESLLFSLSYSGNTEETLKAVKEAEERGVRIVCVTTGGKLRKFAESRVFSLYPISAGYQPRAALPFLLAPLLICLEKIGIISDIQKDFIEAIRVLRGLKAEYSPERPSISSALKQLARKVSDKTPLIFGAVGTTAAAALRMKTQFNENSKLTAGLNLFPELNHNEIVNLSALRRGEHKFCLICLRDEKDSERIKKRMEVTKSLIGTQVGGINEIWSQGKSRLARILSLIYFGDLLSVYAAIARGVDPTEVDVITRLKRELNR